MPFSAAEITNIANSALDHFLGKGEVYENAIQNKPMMMAFDAASGTFPGGKGSVSIAVKSGQGGLTLAGYTHDDAVGYGNPASTKRINFPWREHHIGMGVTHTELKADGVTVTESGATQSVSNKEDREMAALANIFDEKIKEMNEDYAVAWDTLIHGDGTSDAKALAGIRAFILADPSLGATGGLNRTTNTWWRNRAATAAAAAANSGVAAIISAVAGGGVLLQFLQREERQLDRFAKGKRKARLFAGSDFLNAVETELRGNGQYAMTGWKGGGGATDGYMPAVSWNGIEIAYDPTLDALGLPKRCYNIDMNQIKLLYMTGEKMKKSTPARPYDRYVMYRGCTTTAVMVAKQLNTSGVYDIA